MAEIRELAAEELAALEAVRDRPEEEIDLSDPDAPEVKDWSGAVRGALANLDKRPPRP